MAGLLVAATWRSPGGICRTEESDSRAICGTVGCRCHGDPPTRHGPYFQYTRKVAGKTLTRRLNAAQADRYRDWMTNRRRLEELIAAMDDVFLQAAELLLAPTPPTRGQGPTPN